MERARTGDTAKVKCPQWEKDELIGLQPFVLGEPNHTGTLWPALLLMTSMAPLSSSSIGGEAGNPGELL